MEQGIFWAYGLILIIGIIAHIIFALYKKNLKRNILGKYSREATEETSDQYVEYYQKAQKIDFLRVVIWLSVLGIIIYNTADTGFLTGLAIGVGAIILTFGSFIVSLSYYFYLNSEFRVGQTVRVGEKRQGEIMSIKPLYMGIAGKTEDGEHTGDYFLISNKLVRDNVITRVDLHKTAIRKIILTIPFDAEKWGMDYQEMLEALKTYLHELLRTNTPTTVGYYKSYIGYKYKMDIEYKDSGSILLYIGFLDTLGAQKETKQKIISFIESLKKQSKEHAGIQKVAELA